MAEVYSRDGGYLAEAQADGEGWLVESDALPDFAKRTLWRGEGLWLYEDRAGKALQSEVRPTHTPDGVRLLEVRGAIGSAVAGAPPPPDMEAIAKGLRTDG